MKRYFVLFLLGYGLVAQGAIVHRYGFTDGDTVAVDSIGDKDGTLTGTAVISGNQLVLTGTGGVNLPADILDPGLQSVTIEVWFETTSDTTWQRLFDFGETAANGGGGNCIFYTPNSGDNTSRFAIATNGTPSWQTGEDRVNSDEIAVNTLTHIACVYDGAASQILLYQDGALVGNTPTTMRLSGVARMFAYIGDSVYTADPSFNGRVDEFRVYDTALTSDEIRDSFLAGPDAEITTAQAGKPKPANKATDVPRDVVLSWTPGSSAQMHDVYFGTDSDNVNNAEVGSPLLVSPNQDANTYDLGRLEFGKTCFWRIDEVNAPPHSTVTKGNIWSFTVEEYSYPITGVTATASSFSTGAGPENTVNGSGLDTTGLLHSTLDKAMWVTSKSATFPHSITFAFDKVYKLDQMWVWNYNVGLESIYGIGCKDVKIEYSLNGTDWDVLTESTEFAQGASDEDYAHNTTVDFAGAAAQYVRLTISSNWRGLLQQAGLSEVRFFYIPVSPTTPSPASATANVDPRTAVLSWRAGREASSHELYLSTDQQAVIDGTAAVVTPSQASYAPPSLQLASTYYWKVAEVNENEIPTTWVGEVWSFTTATYITLDDFEVYGNDSPYRVFQAWIDGSGFSPDEYFPNGNNGNGTGSLVGYDPLERDVMEKEIVFGGTQCMPLYYDNSVAPKISEATFTFNPAQDWTKHAITTLTLWVHGDPNNIVDILYVKVNDIKFVYNNGASGTTSALWKQWNIDLTSMPNASRKSVTTLTIGVGGGSTGGTGTILVDEIRLYASAPAVAVPTDPGTNGLELLYSMEDNVQDSSGKSRNGTANGDPSYANSNAGLGKALAFDGVNDYVTLPIGTLIGTLTSSSFTAWVNWSGTTNWQRVLDFGTGTTKYMYLTVMGVTSRPQFGLTTTSNAVGAESVAIAPLPLVAGWHHLAGVVDASAMTITLYLDGVPVATGPTRTLPMDLGITTLNYIGRSMWTPDPYYSGLIDDFRIYNRALSEGEVRYLAGDR